MTIRRTIKASSLIIGYEKWLRKEHGETGTYLVNAKTLCRKLGEKDKIVDMLNLHCEGKSSSFRSIMNRFKRYLVETSVDYVINDLPIGNVRETFPIVKAYIEQKSKTLRGAKSAVTYSTVLQRYLSSIKNDISQFNSLTARTYILSPRLSDYTKRHYKSVIKSFCHWVIEFRSLPDKKLTNTERKIKNDLQSIDVGELLMILNIKTPAKSPSHGYHKSALTDDQRERLISSCDSKKDRAILSLMAFNALKPEEITVLQKKNWNPGTETIRIDQGLSPGTIRLFTRPIKELKAFLRAEQISSGELFPGTTTKEVISLIKSQFKKLRLINKGRFTPQSLRHTSAQLMSENQMPLWYIQKALRYKSAITALAYSSQPADDLYLKTRTSTIYR